MTRQGPIVASRLHAIPTHSTHQLSNKTFVAVLCCAVASCYFSIGRIQSVAYAYQHFAAATEADCHQAPLQVYLLDSPLGKTAIGLISFWQGAAVLCRNAPDAFTSLHTTAMAATDCHAPVHSVADNSLSGRCAFSRCAIALHCN